ncbi:hypothetical protein PGT21_017189 [Puccinia graminis f. sp. tritici]|uniref:Uncharacterized protein n=1 Tax=Puccinia graminis f. sp. tritici TaxID=56615 RepID=A0A5B0P4D6_PUCGR|nr:hypothetical protein PGTUg99_024613 [Puccinia graminis f. sp. tritici]KAA1099689.1 hypothetical protein PGT21_017189 [Puccinia graminis f. sp. tritici]
MSNNCQKFSSGTGCENSDQVVWPADFGNSLVCVKIASPSRTFSIASSVTSAGKPRRLLPAPAEIILSTCGGSEDAAGGVFDNALLASSGFIPAEDRHSAELKADFCTLA